jgi:hypothetical protein
MMRIITSKEFLIGAAVGYFAVPLVAKHVRAQVERMRPATTNTTAA